MRVCECLLKTSTNPRLVTRIVSPSGCTLKSDKREFKVDLDGDETEQQLSLKAVCLGAEAEDKFHMVEVEGLTYDGKTTKVPLAVLKPSVLPSMSLGGFEITPPVTFRLQSGSGPVHISGQHFISDDEDDDEYDYFIFCSVFHIVVHIERCHLCQSIVFLILGTDNPSYSL
uniref:Nucleophosmin n=1 Tax=Amphilophus citrinellus TaxID=61819 RepID=A0A3Q0SP61_AMPCI